MINRPLYDRPEIVKYYPAHEETNWLMDRLRDYGLFRNEHKDFVEEMERLRNLRGKSRYGKYAAVNKKKRREEGKWILFHIQAVDFNKSKIKYMLSK